MILDYWYCSFFVDIIPFCLGWRCVLQNCILFPISYRRVPYYITVLWYLYIPLYLRRSTCAFYLLSEYISILLIYHTTFIFYCTVLSSTPVYAAIAVYRYIRVLVNPVCWLWKVGWKVLGDSFLSTWWKVLEDSFLNTWWKVLGDSFLNTWWKVLGGSFLNTWWKVLGDSFMNTFYWIWIPVTSSNEQWVGGLSLLLFSNKHALHVK